MVTRDFIGGRDVYGFTARFSYKGFGPWRVGDGGVVMMPMGRNRGVRGTLGGFGEGFRGANVIGRLEDERRFSGPSIAGELGGRHTICIRRLRRMRSWWFMVSFRLLVSFRAFITGL